MKTSCPVFNELRAETENSSYKASKSYPCLLIMMLIAVNHLRAIIDNSLRRQLVGRCKVNWRDCMRQMVAA